MECVIRLEYETEGEARAVYLSIEPDNYQYVECEMEGSALVIRSSANGPMSLLHTVEDLLACVREAEEAFLASAKP